MATEAAKPVMDRRELFRRLMGRRIDLTTTCKSFERTGGMIKEVFDDFLMFITTKETAGHAEQTRHWVLFNVIAVITEVPKVATEEVEIER